MTDIQTAEFMRIINSVTLSPEDKAEITGRLIKNAGERNIFNIKRAAAAGIAVAIAAGFVIPYVKNKSR
ncbi:MAG: hypothetical protein E7516_02435 [Ruminococcaceae bacterium]|nr:hypothetical protein [Oscillospiraceae bacterium]